MLLPSRNRTVPNLIYHDEVLVGSGWISIEWIAIIFDRVHGMHFLFSWPGPAQLQRSRANWRICSGLTDWESSWICNRALLIVRRQIRKVNLTYMYIETSRSSIWSAIHRTGNSLFLCGGCVAWVSKTPGLYLCRYRYCFKRKTLRSWGVACINSVLFSVP